MMTATYWEIGRRIVHSEKAGEKRAGYGDALIKQLAKDLSASFAKLDDVYIKKEGCKKLAPSEYLGKCRTVVPAALLVPQTLPFGAIAGYREALCLAAELSTSSSAK